MNVYFYECEHGGDLDNYANDLRESGANVLRASCNHETETGVIEIEINDKEKFMKAFSKTESFGYSSLRHGF